MSEGLGSQGAMVIDYSRFDHIGSSDEEEEPAPAPNTLRKQAARAEQASGSGSSAPAVALDRLRHARATPVRAGALAVATLVVDADLGPRDDRLAYGCKNEADDLGGGGSVGSETVGKGKGGPSWPGRRHMLRHAGSLATSTMCCRASHAPGRSTGHSSSRALGREEWLV